MKTLFSVLTLMSTLFLFSCQKEADFNDPSLANNSNSTGSGSAGTTSKNSFHPLTTGTWWKFKDSISGMVSTGTVTNVTKTINSITYKAMYSVMGSQKDTSWMASPEPNYYLTAKGITPSGGSFDLFFHYLNDTAQVGHNWQYSAGQGNGFAAIVTTTIVAKNLSMTVAGKNYKDIIQTRLELSYNIMGSPMEMGSYDYFIAKGVGIVKVRSKLGMMGITMLETCSDLIDYSIK